MTLETIMEKNNLRIYKNKTPNFIKPFSSSYFTTDLSICDQLMNFSWKVLADTSANDHLLIILQNSEHHDKHPLRWELGRKTNQCPNKLAGTSSRDINGHFERFGRTAWEIWTYSLQPIIYYNLSNFEQKPGIYLMKTKKECWKTTSADNSTTKTKSLWDMKRKIAVKIILKKISINNCKK